MPLRGETIGAAYVRILADGSGFADDARRQVSETDDDFRAAGKKSSTEFWKGYNAETKRRGKTPLKTLRDNLEKGVGRFTAVGDMLGTNVMEGLEASLRKRFGKVGTQIAINLRDALSTGDEDFLGISRRLANIRPEVSKATKQLADEQVKQWKEGFARINREIDAGMKRANLTIKQGAAHANVVEALLGEAEADEKARIGTLVNQLGKLKNAVDEYDKQLLKGQGARNAFRTRLVQLTEAMPDAVRQTAAFQKQVRELGDRIDPAGNALVRFRNQVSKSGEVTGRVFGRGSRNDFLNFFGGLVSLLPRVIGGLGKATEAMAGFGREFKKLAEAEGFMSALSASFGAFMKTVPGIIIATGTALASISILLPAFGAALSLVTGLVLALAGSLGFALVGAIGAVGGALIPFATGLGVAALAIGGLQKMAKDKAFKDFVKDFKKDWEGLQKDTAKAMFGKNLENLKVFGKTLQTLRPLILPVAEALGGLVKAFGEVSQTKAFSDLMKNLGATIAPMVTQLGQIGGKFALGIGQAFISLGPFINQFLDWLEQVADRWVAFTTSTSKGDASGFSAFFDRAWQSLKVIGGLILNVITLIGQLFSAGKGTGDSLFQGIADKVKEIVDWLSKPEGQKALKQWFADAKVLGQEIGNVVLKVIAFVDALDTPQSRQMLLFLVQGFGRLIGVFTFLTPLMTKIAQGVTALGRAGVAVVGFFQRLPAIISGALAAISAWASSTWGIITATVSGWAQAVGNFVTVTVPGFFTSLGASISARWTAIWTGLTTIVQSALTALPGILAQVGFAILQAIVGSLVFLWTLPVRITDLFQDLGPKIISALGDLAGKFGAWLSGLPEKAQQTVNNILKWFTGLAVKAIQKAGDLRARFNAWWNSIPGAAAALATRIGNAFKNLATKAISAAGNLRDKFNTWWNSIPGKAEKLVKDIIAAFKGLAGDIVEAAGNLPGKIADWASGVKAKAGQVADDIVSAFSGLASRIVRAIGTIVPNWALPKSLRKASGGIVSSPVVSWIGEEGAEAIVPLNRNLSRVDPAVRALSAIAQGLPIPRGSEIPLPNGDGGGGGPTFNIYTPTENPRAVASEVFARMTAAAYIA